MTTSVAFSTRTIASRVFAQMPDGSTPGCELILDSQQLAKLRSHPLPTMDMLAIVTSRTTSCAAVDTPRISKTRGSRTAVITAALGSGDARVGKRYTMLSSPSAHSPGSSIKSRLPSSCIFTRAMCGGGSSVAVRAVKFTFDSDVTSE
jgi:hypothetical protein